VQHSLTIEDGSEFNPPLSVMASEHSMTNSGNWHTS